jgi:hypothetical protein
MNLRRFVLLLAAGILPLYSQFDSATVLGTVTDASGSAVAAAKVTLEEVRKGITLTARTADSGVYEFPAAPIGHYRIQVEQKGFRSQSSQEFDLGIGARQRVDFRLGLESVQSSVSVSAEVPLVETESSDRGQTIAAKQIRELPLNGRAYSELIYLSTGILRAPSSGSSSAQREASFNANGLRSTFNNFLMDGLDNNYFGTSNQGFSNQVVQPPPDAVAEFRVITNNMSAEYGRSGGATVNASLKSGTNEVHGSAWEFFRNTELNAVGFFKPLTGKPRQNRNQFGGAVGGPIFKNRTFFFADYEGGREVNSSVGFATLPNLQQRQGSLGVAVRNPFSGEIYQNGVIPQQAIIPFARGVMAALPDNTNSAAANNYQTLSRVTDFRDKGDLKIDQYFSEKWRGFFRYSRSRFDVFDPGVIPGLAGGGGNGFQKVPLFSFGGGLTWTINERSILETRLGYSKSDAGKDPPLTGGPSMEELFGIKGLPTEKRYTGGITVQTLTGFSGLGRQATSPQYQHPEVWNPKVNYTRILNRHTLKSGVEYQWLGVETLDVNPILGRDVYSGLFSAPGTAVPAAAQPLYSLADFLFGARSQYQLVNAGIVHHRQQSLFGYVQDDFRVSKTLTLNLGIRYEVVTPFYERDNKLANYDPITNSMILAKDGSLYDRGLVHLDNNNFGPRFGLAWNLAPKTALRAGYGVSYINFNRTGTSYLAYNAPRFILATTSQRPGQPGFRNTQDGYPENFAAPENFNPRLSTVQYIDPKSPSGSVQSWFLSIQRQLPQGVLIDLAYVGNTANNLIIINDLNQALPNRPGENVDVELRRPNQKFSSIAGTVPLGFSNYHGLQARVEKRSDAGFYFLNSFTWSKAMDNASQAFDSNNGNGSSVQNIYDLNADRGLSNYHRKFNNVTSLVYEAPFGRGRRFMGRSPRALDLVLGGWQVNTIMNMRSGAPLTLSYSPTTQQQVVPVISLLGRNAYRPHILRDPLTAEGQRGPNSYLDRSAVFLPSADQPFGNVGRNTVQGFAFYQIDMGISKNFELTERLHLQFRGEAFNVFNHTNFGAPDGNISNQTFGTIRSTFDPRQLQLALKLLF